MRHDLPSPDQILEELADKYDRGMTNAVRWGLSRILDLDHYRASPAARPLHLSANNADVRPQLEFGDFTGDGNGIFGGLSGGLGFLHSVAGGAQGAAKQNHGPDAYSSGDHAESGHDPLGESVLPYEKGLPSKEGFFRLGAFFGLAFPIMIAAARFSGRDWGRNPWRFLGGPFGGLTLWLCSGVLILGWPFLRLYGVLP